MRRSGIKIMAELIGLIAPLIHIMILAIITGVLGFLCAIFITILGGYGNNKFYRFQFQFEKYIYFDFYYSYFERIFSLYRTA